MKRFRFSLNALLTLRKRQENLALDQYGCALRAQRKAILQVQDSEEQLAKAWADLCARLEGRCTAGELACQRAQCAAVEEKALRARDELRRAEQALQTSYLGLVEARRQRQLVGRLREHRLRDYEKEAARSETRFLDELALRRRPALLQFHASL